MKISSTVRISIVVFIVFVTLVIVKGVDIYDKAFRPNISIPSGEPIHFFVDEGDSVENILAKLDSLGIIVELNDLNWVIKKKNYQNFIHPGKYKIENGMTNNQLVNILRSGNQEVVWYVLAGRIRSVEEVAERASKVTSLNKTDLLAYLNNEPFIDSLGFSKETILSMFLPNSYQFYWYTTPKGFMYRMKKEYDKFWNSKRIGQAEAIGFTPTQIMTIASIVTEETIKTKEMPTVAGVYINRLDIGMRLQADPTVKFAHQNFEIRRLRHKHLTINSPYNTYKYSGLPPGPIGIPTIEAIEAVLDYEKHKYLYFCAKDDFSGYHVFAKTLAQHNKNASKYQRALNKRKIYN